MGSQVWNDCFPSSPAEQAGRMGMVCASAGSSCAWGRWRCNLFVLPGGTLGLAPLCVKARAEQQDEGCCLDSFSSPRDEKTVEPIWE